MLDQSWVTRIGVLLFVPLTIWQGGDRGSTAPAAVPGRRAVPAAARRRGRSRCTTGRTSPSRPTAWTPAVVQALLATAALIAGCFAASGLWFERRAALSAALGEPGGVGPRADPGDVLRARRRIPAARGLGRLRRAAGGGPDGRRCGGAAGEAAASGPASTPPAPSAALALGCAMLLRDQWLTLAVSLLLPALAWIAAQADLPALRRVALAVAGRRAGPAAAERLRARLRLRPLAGGERPAGGLCAAGRSRSPWRRRCSAGSADDLTVGVLEAGSVALATVFVALEIRQGVGPAERPARTPEFGFPEAALRCRVAGGAGCRHDADRPTVLGGRCCTAAWRVQGALALAGGVLLILDNPDVHRRRGRAACRCSTGCCPAYLVPALLAVVALAQRRLPTQPPALRPLLAGYALVAGFVWITLEVRHLFHPGPIGLDGVAVEDAELWAWSGAWLAYGVGRDGDRHRHREPAPAAGGAGDRRPDHGQGVPGGHVRPGRAVAGAVVPRVWALC